MQRTLIAVFNNRGDAQSALDELVASGCAPDQMRLSDADSTGAAATADSGKGQGMAGGIRQFLSNMLGTDRSEHVQRYSDAVTRGHHLLTLTVFDVPDIERATAIVERWGPVDIDEKVTEWGGGALASEAMRSGVGAQQQSAPVSQQSVQGAVQGGSQQQGSGAADLAPTQRSGVRVFEHLAEPPLDAGRAADADEAYYRSHYESNYADVDDQYDDYAPAYKYGTHMASNELYRGRAWKDVEPQLRTDWEGNYPGSAWTRFKEAVRHGWERMTS